MSDVCLKVFLKKKLCVFFFFFSSQVLSFLLKLLWTELSLIYLTYPQIKRDKGSYSRMTVSTSNSRKKDYTNLPEKLKATGLQAMIS